MIESQCSTSFRPNTKKNAKTKGRVYMTSDMSIHRYSQHALLHKRKREKESQILSSGTTGHWVQNKATYKNECQKGRKKGENVENGEKWPLTCFARLRESIIVGIFLFVTAGVGLQQGLRHIMCFTQTTERAKRVPKLGLNDSRSL